MKNVIGRSLLPTLLSEQIIIKLLYYAYAHSILQYGILVWGNSTEASKLFTLQKKCIRNTANIGPMESCKAYFTKYSLTLTSLYIMETCISLKTTALYSFNTRVLQTYDQRLN